MPLADVLTFYMATPLIITALSAPLLGEKVERFRWIAVRSASLGSSLRSGLRRICCPGPRRSRYSGDRLCAEPDDHARSPGHPLGPARSLAIRRHGSCRAATIPWAWTTPSLFDLDLMFLVGVVAMICIICVVRALGFARVAVLAPLQYTGAAVGRDPGWLIWRDVPTLPIVVGNAIIIGSGLYVAARGKMVGRRRNRALVHARRGRGPCARESCQPCPRPDVKSWRRSV